MKSIHHSRLVTILMTCFSLLCWQSHHVQADSLSTDEAAIAAHIKALFDMDSEVRAAAAQALRLIVAKYPSGTSNIRDKDSGEAKWQVRLDRIEVGMKKAQVLESLPPFTGSSDEYGMGSGQSHVSGYRLDNNWTMRASYRNPDVLMERPMLIKQERFVYVPPPENYTGTWACWYVNGQKGHQAQYKDGHYDGVLTSFHDNGQKRYEQHYVDGKGNGTDTGWSPDGRVSYKGQYKNGKQDGTWTHWYPNGKKSSERSFKSGEPDGRHAQWYENGQMRFEMNYRNGVRHGIDAAWNERGVLQYKREYANGVLTK